MRSITTFFNAKAAPLSGPAVTPSSTDPKKDAMMEEDAKMEPVEREKDAQSTLERSGSEKKLCFSTEPEVRTFDGAEPANTVTPADGNDEEIEQVKPGASPTSRLVESSISDGSPVREFISSTEEYASISRRFYDHQRRACRFHE